MPTVPTYDLREVRPRPEYQQGINVRATPSAFGADIGEGLANVGRGLGQAADAFSQLRDFEDKLKARDAQTAFDRDKMELDYGANGYFTTQGRDAVDRRDQYNADLEELKKKHGAGLSGGAARYFDGAVTTAVTGGMREAIVHSAQGRKDWAATSSIARLSTFQDQALNGYQDADAVNKAVTAGYMEIDAQADLMGWGPEVVTVKRQEFATQVYSGVALALAGETGGATKAMDYLKIHADMIDPKKRMELEGKLKPYAVDEAALGTVNDILKTPRRDIGAGIGVARGTVSTSGPTTIRSRLYARAADAGKGKDHVDGLTESFAVNLDAMFQDAPPAIRDGLQIGSGYRTDERQAQLWADAVKKYGSEAEARRWVAPPGMSEHNSGTAVDIWYKGQRLDKAPDDVRQWVHDHASDYGLRFPMSWESWHIEPANARGGAGSTVVATHDKVSVRASLPSYDDAMAKVMEIQDPAVRASALKQLNATFEMRSKAENAAASDARAQIWSQVAQGVPMSQIPIELKIAAGREAVQGFIDYENKSGEINTDPVLSSKLTLLAATNPVEFSKIDLTAPEVINSLSKSDLKVLVDKQASVLQDERKAREDGINVSQAMGYAKTQLEAVGISTNNLKGSERQKMAKREAAFQMALADEMRVWSEAHNGKQPGQIDITQMTNKLLLPIVIKTPDSFKFWGESKLYFEAGGRADGATVDVVVQYGDIPIDLRRGIALDLERELSRKPSEDEIVQRYEDFILSR